MSHKWNDANVFDNHVNFKYEYAFIDHMIIIFL
jgi:hypothetical protein